MSSPNATHKQSIFAERRIPRGDHQLYVRDYAGAGPAFGDRADCSDSSGWRDALSLRTKRRLGRIP